MDQTRTVTWRVFPSEGFETAWVALGGATMSARGRAVGTSPTPYWLTYDLETGDDYVTRSLRVKVEQEDRVGKLELRNDEGDWSANGEDLPQLAGALDCDLGLCPLTNTMPILRHELHSQPGQHESLMAWVAVPELTVKPSRQTYTHLGAVAGGSGVRYESGTFTSALVIDGDGLVLEYPKLATRVAG